LEKDFGAAFLRGHQSFLVNMEYVKRISNYKLTLNNDIVLPVPKARFKQALRRYEEYQWNKILENNGE
jgi:DNA-binding LytR/AlgR family response regulator